MYNHCDDLIMGCNIICFDKREYNSLIKRLCWQRNSLWCLYSLLYRVYGGRGSSWDWLFQYLNLGSKNTSLGLFHSYWSHLSYPENLCNFSCHDIIINDYYHAGPQWLSILNLLQNTWILNHNIPQSCLRDECAAVQTERRFN